MVSKESLLFWNMLNNKDGVINTVHTPVARGTKILSGADGHLLSSTDEKYFSRNPQTGTSTTFTEWKKAGRCTCISFWICVFQILGMKKAVLCEVAGLFTNPWSWDRQELDHRNPDKSFSDSWCRKTPALHRGGELNERSFRNQFELRPVLLKMKMEWYSKS